MTLLRRVRTDSAEAFRQSGSSVRWYRGPLLFARQSLSLDLQLLRRRELTARQRLELVLKKYVLLLRHTTREFEIGSDSVTLWGERLYYDSPYGLAGYEGLLTRTAHLLDVAQVHTASTVMDVGANVGFFSLMASSRFAGARIIAIEPLPAAFDCLRRNTSRHPNIEPVQAAASDAAGVLRMRYARGYSARGFVAGDGDGGVEVAARTLDEIARERDLSTIDLLKIDVETFEAHVLRGAQAVLSATRFILIEVSLLENDRYTVPSLFSLLTGPTHDFQLVAMRNFSNKSQGPVPYLDCVFQNVAIDRS